MLPTTKAPSPCPAVALSTAIAVLTGQRALGHAQAKDLRAPLAVGTALLTANNTVIAP